EALYVCVIPPNDSRARRRALPGRLLFELELKQHPMLQPFMIKQVDVTRLRDDVPRRGKAGCGRIDLEEIVELAGAQVGEPAWAKADPEGDLAVALVDPQIVNGSLSSTRLEWAAPENSPPLLRRLSKRRAGGLTV